VIWAPPTARWLIGAGLLLPSLLMLHPSGLNAETKSPTKRVAPKERPPRKSRAAVAPSRSGAEDRCFHLVRRGESLPRIAARYRSTQEEIITANHLSSSAAPKAGRRLSIPGCRSAARPRGQTISPVAAIELDDGLYLARVGPLRVPTRLYVDVPDFNGEAVEFAWPVEGLVASWFGRRRTGWHAGIDIQAEGGRSVLAAAAGSVAFSGWAPYYGRVIKIQHLNGFVTVYAHNSENLVQVGDQVGTGAVIATVGRSGRASGDHLHFEVRRDGMAFNPLYLLESRDNAPVLASIPGEPLEDEVDDEGRE